MSEGKAQQKVTGTITRVSSAQTVHVSFKVTKVHPLYHKRYSQMRHFTAHDPKNTAKVGDVVDIIPCRPVSKSKSWVIV